MQRPRECSARAVHGRSDAAFRRGCHDWYRPPASRLAGEPSGSGLRSRSRPQVTAIELLRHEMPVLFIRSGLGIEPEFRLRVVFGREHLRIHVLHRAIRGIVEFFLPDHL